MASNATGRTSTTSVTNQGGSVHQKGFTITTKKQPILKAGPIEDMAARLGVTPPEMIFGDNSVSIKHEASGWSIDFNAFDALDKVDKTGEAMLKVSYSNQWQQYRQHHQEGIKEVVKPFDWSYTTDYKGSLPFHHPAFEPSTTNIPLSLLKRPDPILFFDDVMLYEDELADNGIAVLSCKLRVMPDRMLLLSRFFLRLDNVVFRLRDTRVFVEFATREVIREYTAREEKYDVIKGRLAASRDDVPEVMRDPNRLCELLPVVGQSVERLLL